MGWRYAVVRITEGVRTTKVGRPADEAAAEADQIQTAAVRRAVTTRQDAWLRRRHRRPHRRCRHSRTYNEPHLAVVCTRATGNSRGNSRDFFLSLNLDYLRTNLTVESLNYALNAKTMVFCYMRLL